MVVVQGKALLSGNYCMDLTLYFLCLLRLEGEEMLLLRYPYLVPLVLFGAFATAYGCGIGTTTILTHMHGLLGLLCMGPPAAVDWVVWYNAFCFFLRQIAVCFFPSRIGGRLFLEFCDARNVVNEMQLM